MCYNGIYKVMSNTEKFRQSTKKFRSSDYCVAIHKYEARIKSNTEKARQYEISNFSWTYRPSPQKSEF